MKLRIFKLFVIMLGALSFQEIIIPDSLKSSISNVQQISKLIHNLPEPNDYFTGREKIINNIQELFNDKKNQVVISGFLGTGKTQVVRKYAEINRDKYDIIWILDSRKSIVDQYRTLAGYINQSNLLENSEKINVNAQPKLILDKINDFLKNTPKKWLLIFDNVRSRGEILDSLPPANKHSAGYVLITTRSESGWENLLKLGKFQRQDSIQLLQKVTQIRDLKELEKLASFLFDHPLSLTQAACYIRKYNLEDVEKYINIFKVRRGDLWKKEAQLLKSDHEIKDIHDDYQNTAEIALKLTIEDLKSHSEQAQRLLSLSSFWHNNKIPEDVLAAFIEFEGYDPIFDYNEVINELTKMSLFEKDRVAVATSKSESTYNMHDLTQLVLLDMQSSEEKEKNIKKNLLFFAKFFSGGWDKITKHLSSRPHLLAHLETLCRHARDLKIYESSLIELETYLLEYQMYHTRDQASYEKRIVEIEELLKETKSADPIIKSRFFIDRVYSRSIFKDGEENRRKQVEKDYEKALIDFRSHPDSIDELFRGYFNFAQFYFFQGDFNRTFELLDEAEKIIKNVKSISYKNLYYFTKAWILSENGQNILAKSSISNAINNLEQEENVALQIYIKKMKGWTELKLGNYEEAYKWSLLAQNEALNFFEKQNNDLIAWTAMTIGLYKFRKGNYLEAEKSLKESLERFKHYYGGDMEHSDQAYCHLALGNVYLSQGKLINAKQEYQTSEKIYYRLYSKKEGEGMSELYIKFAILGAKLGDDFLAMHYLDLHRKNFGKDHPGTKEIVKELRDNNMNVVL